MSKVPIGKEKNTDIGLDDHARSQARATNHQKVSGGIKRNFVDRNEVSKRGVIRDESEINNVRKGNKGL